MPWANTPTQNWSKVTPKMVTLSNNSGRATSTSAIASGPMARFQPRAGGRGGASPWAPPALRRSTSNASVRSPFFEKLYPMRNTSITTNGMLACTPDEKNPLSGCTFTQSCCSSPTPIAPTNASGRLVMRPITTAANEPTRRSVNWNSSSPTIGDSSTPANPASITPTIHEPAVTASVFTPAIPALRGWSTVMRVARPSDVNRRMSVATIAIPAALRMTTNWFSLT